MTSGTPTQLGRPEPPSDVETPPPVEAGGGVEARHGQATQDRNPTLKATQREGKTPSPAVGRNELGPLDYAFERLQHPASPITSPSALRAAVAQELARAVQDFDQYRARDRLVSRLARAARIAARAGRSPAWLPRLDAIAGPGGANLLRDAALAAHGGFDDYTDSLLNDAVRRWVDRPADTLAIWRMQVELDRAARGLRLGRGNRHGPCFFAALHIGFVFTDLALRRPTTRLLAPGHRMRAGDFMEFLLAVDVEFPLALEPVPLDRIAVDVARLGQIEFDRRIWWLEAGLSPVATGGFLTGGWVECATRERN